MVCCECWPLGLKSEQLLSDTELNRFAEPTDVVDGPVGRIWKLPLQVLTGWRDGQIETGLHGDDNVGPLKVVYGYSARLTRGDVETEFCDGGRDRRVDFVRRRKAR